MSTNSYIKVIETGDITNIVDEGLNVVLRPQFFSQTEADDILEQLIAEIINHGEDQILSHFRTEKRNLQRQQVSYGDRDLMHTFCGNMIDINKWTPGLSKLRFHIEKSLGIRYNFCVVNWRSDGHVRIGSHMDIGDDLEPDIPVIRISLGPARKFLFVHRNSNNPKGKSVLREPKFWVYKFSLPPGSVIEMKGQTDGFWYVDLPANADAKKNTRVSVTFCMIRSIRNVRMRNQSNTDYAIRTLDYDLVPMSTTLSASSGSKKSEERGRIQELQARRADQEQEPSITGTTQRQRRISRERNKQYIVKRKKLLSRAQSAPIKSHLSEMLQLCDFNRRSYSEERGSTMSITSGITSDMTTRSTEQSYESALNLPPWESAKPYD